MSTGDDEQSENGHTASGYVPEFGSTAGRETRFLVCLMISHLSVKNQKKATACRGS
jgi:hypothetical protein